MVATTTAQKAARMQVQAAQKAAARAHAQAMRALPRQPTIRLVKEVRSGNTSMSFYRKFDHRSGRVSSFWTLNRDTSRGRVRVASGPMSEFKNLREVVNRSLGREAPQQARDASRQAPEASRQAPRPQEAARGPREGRGGREGRGRKEGRFDGGTDDTNRRKEPVYQPKKASYSVVYVEGVNRDGSARTRVAKSFGSLKEAKAAQKHDKRMVVHRHYGRGLLGRGDVVNLPENHSPNVAARLKEIRKHSRPNDRGQAVNGRDVGADQARRRDVSIER